MVDQSEAQSLQLTVLFDDQATAGIEKLRADLADFTTGSGKARLDTFRREHEQNSKLIKEGIEAALRGQKGLFDFGIKMGGLGLVMGATGLAIHEGMENLDEYSEKLVRLGAKAELMAVALPELKSIIEQYKAVGVPANIVERSMERFSQKLGALNRLGSPERQQLINDAGSFASIMLETIDEMVNAPTRIDALNIAIEKSFRVYNNRFEETNHNAVDANKAQNDFLRDIGIDPELKRLRGLRAVTDEEKKTTDERYANAKTLHEALAAFYHEEEELAADVINSFSKADGIVIRGIHAFTDLLHELRTFVPGTAATAAKLSPDAEAACKEIAKAFVTDVRNDPVTKLLRRRAGLPETGLFHQPRLPIGTARQRILRPAIAPARLLGELPTPTGGARGGTDWGAVAERWRKIFGQSGNIEDRRALGQTYDDLTDAVVANEAQMKKLNDAIDELIRASVECEESGLPGILRGKRPGMRGGARKGGRTPPGIADFSGGAPSRGAVPGGGATPGGGGGGATGATVPAGGATPGAAAEHPMYNYFQRMGEPGPYPREKLVTVKTAYGPIQVHPDAAADFAGFYGDLAALGAPIKKLGSYNPRQKRWSRGWSSHAYGAATDWDDAAKLPPELANWLQQHKAQVDAIKEKWNIGQPLPEKDAPHFEWRGPHGSSFAKGAGGDRPSTNASPTPGRSERQSKLNGNPLPSQTAADERAQIDRAITAEQEPDIDLAATLFANVTAPRGTQVTLEGGGLFNKTQMNRQISLS